MSAVLHIEKAILQDPRIVPANGNYPAKTQIKLSCGFDLYLSSETVDLVSFPVLEPVSVTAHVTRMGGGKGFFVASVDQIEVKPFVPVTTSSKK